MKGTARIRDATSCLFKSDHHYFYLWVGLRWTSGGGMDGQPVLMSLFSRRVACQRCCHFWGWDCTRGSPRWGITRRWIQHLLELGICALTTTEWKRLSSTLSLHLCRLVTSYL